MSPLHQNKSNRIVLLVGSVLLAAAVMNGCSSQPPNTVHGPGYISKDHLAFDEYPQIVPLERVQKLIVLRGRPVEETDAGVYSVRVPLRSISGRSESLRYRFVYFASDGSEVERDSWVSVSVPAGAAIQAKGRSVRSGISEWRLEIGRVYGIGESP